MFYVERHVYDEPQRGGTPDRAPRPPSSLLPPDGDLRTARVRRRPAGPSFSRFARGRRDAGAPREGPPPNLPLDRGRRRKGGRRTPPLSPPPWKGGGRVGGPLRECGVAETATFPTMARFTGRARPAESPPAALFNLARAGAGFWNSRLSNGLARSRRPAGAFPAAFPVRNGPEWSGIVRDSPGRSGSSAVAGAAGHPVDLLDRRLGLPERADRIDETDCRRPSRNDGPAAWRREGDSNPR